MSSEQASYLQKGIDLKIEGRYDEAVTALTTFLTTDPDHPDGHHQMGLVYGFTGLFDESLEELQKASALAPERVDIRMDLALTYSMLAMYDEAKVEFEQVLVKDPTNRRALDSMKFLTESF